MKLMHTRVYGQFAVISMLLTLMGFKSYMDSHGKFITETEAQMRVDEMQRMRENLIERLAFDKQMKEHRETLLRKAHEDTLKEAMEQAEQVQEGHSEKSTEKKRKKKRVQHKEEEQSEDGETVAV